MQYQCHVCLRLVKTDGENPIIKCKLCCDGLECDVCNYCAKIYNGYRTTGDKLLFKELQALRLEGISKQN